MPNRLSTNSRIKRLVGCICALEKELKDAQAKLTAKQAAILLDASDHCRALCRAYDQANGRSPTFTNPDDAIAYLRAE